MEGDAFMPQAHIGGGTHNVQSDEKCYMFYMLIRQLVLNGLHKK
jgi:hypothetical protein